MLKLKKPPLLLVAFLILLYVGIFTLAENSSNDIIPDNLSWPAQIADQKIPNLEFDKLQHSLSEPGSLWWVVNKTRPLPDGYVPPDLVVPDVKLRLASDSEQMQLRSEPAAITKQMFEAAKADGVNLVFGSGYRSQEYQKVLYDGYVASNGQAEADKYSAKPGTSEHQTGLTFDATTNDGSCHLEECFKDTSEGKWLFANAYKYGFHLRYPDGKANTVGYEYEPWHYRYVGVELASELRKLNTTIEEFFGL